MYHKSFLLHVIGSMKACGLWVVFRYYYFLLTDISEWLFVLLSFGGMNLMFNIQ